MGWPFSCSTNREEARVPRVNEEKEKKNERSQRDSKGLHTRRSSRTLTSMLNEMGNHWVLFNRQMTQSDLHI